MPAGDSVNETSPRSTVITASLPVNSGIAKMSSTNGESGGDRNVANMASAENVASSSDNVPAPGNPEKSVESNAEVQSDPSSNGEKKSADRPTSPLQSALYHQTYPVHLTPQPGAGYYLGYQSQVTPEPPSPAGPGAAIYDVGSFFQQQAAFGTHSSPFGVSGQFTGPSPLSPLRTSATMGGIPPASPLFPRVPSGNASALAAGVMDAPRVPDSATLQRGTGTPLSPSVPYLSPPLGQYQQAYGANAPGAQSNSPDEISGGWGDRSGQQNIYQQGSPQITAQGIAVPYVTAGVSRPTQGRSYSFEESMLPPSALEQQPDHSGNPAFSPYGGGQGTSGALGGTLFAHQQPWGYGGPGDLYNPPGSPLQPRPAPPQMPLPYGAHPGMPGGFMRTQMNPHGQYYPATSPGPPIQTTSSNKGPDGANLFIFHIPNHFTNLDMYHLFCPYGNLLSVRIMVEKETGRSRGFGFVSYDSPDSAALAIKELNGFAIGNKRLKVQHKQIRQGDQQHRDHPHRDGPGAFGLGHAADAFPRMGGPPPPGTVPGVQELTAPAQWYETRKAAPPGGESGGDPGDRSHDHGLMERKDENVERGPPTHAAPGGGEAGVDYGTSAVSPLSNLEPLRNSLPDVAGPVE